MRFKGICRLVGQRDYASTIDFMATHFWIIVFYCRKSLQCIHKPPVAISTTSGVVTGGGFVVIGICLCALHGIWF